uniref:Septin-5-like n=1 Tax=Gouania willdenowi TaxID=441366 RepID=A0A8C5H036_GOUWI
VIKNTVYRRITNPLKSDQDKDYVGFATLPNQVHRKTVKKGFTFTLMVAGESGLGKSTLINSLFLTDLYKDRKVLNAEERICQTVDIVKHTIGIEEKGVKLRLTIIDTPGLGDAVNNTDSWFHIEQYIDQQFEQYFRDESGLNRRNIQDNRVHCCLYFISPFGHGLRPLDVECMRALHEKVNIIPVLAKADSLTRAEIFKKKRKEIKQFGINIYEFPECDSDDDDEFRMQEQILKDSIPFAVIGSNIQVESKGHKFRGRIYPWGVVEVENPAHSDFLLLRNMLVRTHMQDLKDITRETHYENYRAQCIQNMTQKQIITNIESVFQKLQLKSTFRRFVTAAGLTNIFFYCYLYSIQKLSKNTAKVTFLGISQIESCAKKNSRC